MGCGYRVGRRWRNRAGLSRPDSLDGMNTLFGVGLASNPASNRNPRSAVITLPRNQNAVATPSQLGAARWQVLTPPPPW